MKVTVTIKKWNGVMGDGCKYTPIKYTTSINKKKLLKEALKAYMDECFSSYDRGKEELEDDIKSLAKVKVLKNMIKSLK